MWRSLTIAALLALVPAAAMAGPVVAAVGGFLAATGPLGFLGPVLGNLLGSVALSALAYAINPPKSPNAKRELQIPNSLPPKRTVYGRARTYGSWAPVRGRGKILFGCLILSSRPSASIEEVLFDKRLMVLSEGDDIYDFAEGGGAGVENEMLDGDRVRLWVGLGDQTSPPADLLAEFGDDLLETDGMQGCTVLWVRLDVGGKEKRAERWPRVPPEVEVTLRGAPVWDPRDEDQDPDDPDTWVWSDNQALIAIDAMRFNPVAQYRLSQFALPSWIEAANVADEEVGLKAGGTQPRYRANGVIIWQDGVEVGDQLAPILAAGAMTAVPAGGLIYAVPGKYYAPVETIGDVLADAPLRFRRWAEGRSLSAEMRARYVAPDRDWQMAELEPYVVAGAAAEDGGYVQPAELELSMVTDPLQAQRLQKIAALQARMQRQVECVLPARYFRRVPGTPVTLALPGPRGAANGIFVIRKMTPMASPLGEDGAVALRIPTVLQETAAAIWAWTPSTDERDVYVPPPFVAARTPLAPPSGIVLVTGATVLILVGRTETPRVRFAFAPSPSGATLGYEWQFRCVEDGDEWQDGGWIDTSATLDPDGRLFGFVAPVVPGQTYAVRVRALGEGRTLVERGRGQFSDWIESDEIEAVGRAVTLPAPVIEATDGRATSILVIARASASADVSTISLYEADSNDSALSTLWFGPVPVGPSGQVTALLTGLPGATTKWLFARCDGLFGVQSPFSDGVSETTL
jgi:hypothetical protein